MKAFLTTIGCVCLLLLLVGLTELGILPEKFISPQFLLGIAFLIGIKLLGIQTKGDGGTGHSWGDPGGGGGGWGDGGNGGDGGGD